MPIYEYQCDDCGASFEVMQKMSEDPLTECEKCGGPLRKVLVRALGVQESTEAAPVFPGQSAADHRRNLSGEAVPRLRPFAVF